MGRTKAEKEAELARRRAEIIFKVRSGQMTAKEGARALGVSRKTYYEWENRALEVMTTALGNGTPGRPRKEVDREKEALKARVEELEAQVQLHKTALRVRELLNPSIPEPESVKEYAPQRKVRAKTAAKKNERQKQ